MYAIKSSTLIKNVRLISLFALSIFFIQRLTLLAWSIGDIPINISELGSALLLGALFDISFIIYALIPLACLFILFPKFKNLDLGKKIFWIALDIFNFIFIFFVLYMAVSEMFFWDEFKSRFNFIAVDYLIYTTEVLKNIWESYPALKILIGLFISSLIVLIQINKRLSIETNNSNFGAQKLKFAVVSGCIIAINFIFMNQKFSENLQDIPYQEISKNGVYSLFYAYFENQINYDQFYIKLDTEDAFKNVEKNISASFSEINSLKRNIFYERHNKKPLNVILVLMESMGARFMNSYGSKENLTPNLDFLASNGLFYNNLYATGTRTVRGIEAVTLSVPPTPGQSIVRRPNNENLITLNSYFADVGYDVQFLYGGYSYFDNMKYYFENNNTSVLDISDIPKSKISFSNAWGVCDEDLFKFSSQRADESHKNKKPFFQILLTTSNHRPYTYPDGKIDIPSGSGRKGAVKYADYAIGQFINSVQDKEWFSNTIFVFVADHDAGVAGNTEVNKNDYLIPVIFFAPKHIKQEVVSNLASQIDVGPTLLGILNLSHESVGFGMDLRKYNPERAFISNYQKIGLLKKDLLTILEPVRKFKQFKLSGSEYKNVSLQKEELEETVSYYQTASYLFKNDKLKSKHEKRKIN